MAESYFTIADLHVQGKDTLKFLETVISNANAKGATVLAPGDIFDGANLTSRALGTEVVAQQQYVQMKKKLLGNFGAELPHNVIVEEMKTLDDTLKELSDEAANNKKMSETIDKDLKNINAEFKKANKKVHFRPGNHMPKSVFNKLENVITQDTNNIMSVYIPTNAPVNYQGIDEMYEVKEEIFEKQLEKALSDRVSAKILMLHRPENIAYRNEDEFPISLEDQEKLIDKYRVIIRAHSHVGYDIQYIKKPNTEGFGTLIVQATAQDGYFTQIDTDDDGNPIKITVFHSDILEKNYQSQQEAQEKLMGDVQQKAVKDTLKLYDGIKDNDKYYNKKVTKAIEKLEKVAA